MGQIHHDVESGFLARNPNARSWLRGFLTDFSVSWAATMRIQNAEIDAAILKPDSRLDNLLGLAGGEVLLVHSSYPDLQRRVFQAASALFSIEPFRFRVAPLFYLLASPARDIDSQVRSFLLLNTEERTIVPLPEATLASRGTDEHFVRQQLATWLFRRNLFDAHGPLKTELFYFGRQQFANELINAVQAGQSFGIFGLRKTGKTSLLLRLERMLRPRGCRFLFLDAQNPGIYQLRWWEVIGRICQQIGHGWLPGSEVDRISERNASDVLQATIKALRKRNRARPPSVVVAIDEIEHIVPGMCSAPHWNDDYLHLWRALRAIHTSEQNFSVIVCGVNGSVLETATYQHFDNPLYQFASPRYIPPLDHSEVREMVGTLARAMGVHVEDGVYDYLLERYGGHTLLTRMACKVEVNKIIETNSMPARLLETDLRAHEVERDRQLHADIDNVLELLRRWYRNEWEMLGLLATGETAFFDDMAATDPRTVQHLVSYGLVTGVPARLKVPVLRMFLEESGRSTAGAPVRGSDASSDAEPAADGLDDLLAETGRTRNRLERKLRKFVKRVLRTRHGDAWIRRLLESVPEDQRKLLQGVDADRILNERLFLLTLIDSIARNWPDCFDVLGKGDKSVQVSKEAVTVLLHFVNGHREDAHAKDTSAATVAAVKTAAAALEAAIDRYLED